MDESVLVNLSPMQLAQCANWRRIESWYVTG